MPITNRLILESKVDIDRIYWYDYLSGEIWAFTNKIRKYNFVM
ncbi:MAG: hypothetical protein K0R54_5500 [Clostridiaceae bacterium]|jgi:hypothetical protein|nr:hypothetical protein [Clostridium sp.]MDF2884929.1 hypothetical protein [Clostridiaceae bacterium]